MLLNWVRARLRARWMHRFLIQKPYIRAKWTSWTWKSTGTGGLGKHNLKFEFSHAGNLNFHGPTNLSPKFPEGLATQRLASCLTSARIVSDSEPLLPSKHHLIVCLNFQSESPVVNESYAESWWSNNWTPRKTVFSRDTGSLAICEYKDCSLLYDQSNITSQIIDDQIGECGKRKRMRFKVAQETCTLPSSMIISHIDLVSRDPIHGGGCADIYRVLFGQYAIALKVLRIFNEADMKVVLQVCPIALILFSSLTLRKELCKEAIVWRQLNHDNVASFLGFSGICSQIGLH